MQFRRAPVMAGLRRIYTRAQESLATPWSRGYQIEGLSRALPPKVFRRPLLALGGLNLCGFFFFVIWIRHGCCL